jgi:RNase P protein component
MNDTKFPISERLKSRSDVDRVKKEGRRRALPEVVLFFCQVSRIAALRSRLRGVSGMRLRATDIGVS